MASQLRFSGVSLSKPASFLRRENWAPTYVRLARPGALQPAPRRRVQAARASNTELHCNCRELPDGSLLFTFKTGTSTETATHVSSTAKITSEEGIDAAERIQPRTLIQAAEGKDSLGAGLIAGVEGAGQPSDPAEGAYGIAGASVGSFSAEETCSQMNPVAESSGSSSAAGSTEATGSETYSVVITPGFKEFNVQVGGGTAVVTVGGTVTSLQADSFPHQSAALAACEPSTNGAPSEVQVYQVDSAADGAVRASVEECGADSVGKEIAEQLREVTREMNVEGARSEQASVHHVGTLTEAMGQVQQVMEEQRVSLPSSRARVHVSASLGANSLNSQVVASVACPGPHGAQLSNPPSGTLLRNGGYTPLMLVLAVGPLIVHLVRRMLKEKATQGLGPLLKSAKDPQEVQRLARETLGDLGKTAAAGGRAVAGWYADAMAQMGRPDGNPVENIKKLFMKWSTPLEVNVAAVAATDEDRAAAVGGDRETYGAWAAVAAPVRPAEAAVEESPPEAPRPATEVRRRFPVVSPGKQEARAPSLGKQEAAPPSLGKEEGAAPNLGMPAEAPKEELPVGSEVLQRPRSSFRKPSPILAMKQLHRRKVRVAEQIRAAEAAPRPPTPEPPAIRLARPASRFEKPSPILAARAAAKAAEEGIVSERGVHLRRPHRVRIARARIPRPTSARRVSKFQKPSPIAAFRTRERLTASSAAPSPPTPTEPKKPAVPRPASKFMKLSPIARWRTLHSGVPSTSRARRNASAMAEAEAAAEAKAAAQAQAEAAAQAEAKAKAAAEAEAVHEIADSLPVADSAALASEAEQPEPQAAGASPGLSAVRPVRPVSSFKKPSPILAAPAAEPEVAVAEASAKPVRASPKASPVAAARARKGGRAARPRKAAEAVLQKGQLPAGEAKEVGSTAEEDAPSEVFKGTDITSADISAQEVASLVSPVPASEPSLQPSSVELPAPQPEQSKAEGAMVPKESEVPLESALSAQALSVVEEEGLSGSEADSVVAEQAGVLSAAASVAAAEPSPETAVSPVVQAVSADGLTGSTPLVDAASIAAPAAPKAKAPRSRSKRAKAVVEAIDSRAAAAPKAMSGADALDSGAAVVPKAKAGAEGLDSGAAAAEVKPKPPSRARVTSPKAGSDGAVAVEAGAAGAEGGLAALTLVALKEMAKARGLKGYSKLKKADLVAMLQEDDLKA